MHTPGWGYGGIGHYPAADHPPGSMREIFDEDSGLYVGQIPEVSHTYNVVGYHGGWSFGANPTNFCVSHSRKRISVKDVCAYIQE